MNQSSYNDKIKQTNGYIGYGNQTKRGGHDHRTNKGDDRTPAQKVGDKARRKS